MIDVLAKRKCKVKIVTARMMEPRQSLLYITTVYSSNKQGVITLDVKDKYYNRKKEDAIISHKSLVDGYMRNGYVKAKEHGGKS